MKVLLPAAAAAVLMVAPAAFAAGPAPAGHAAKMPAKSASHIRPVSRMNADAATTALNLLEAQGYGGFTNFRRNGRFYEATVSQSGKTFQVKVDPATRQVTHG